jgi:hypothetical protein
MRIAGYILLGVGVFFGAIGLGMHLDGKRALSDPSRPDLERLTDGCLGGAALIFMGFCGAICGLLGVGLLIASFFMGE